MSDFQKPPSKLRRAVPLLLLVLACGLPVAAAWVFYLNPDLLPASRGNFGRLIEPPYPLRHIRLVTAAGKDVRFDDAQGKWSLLWLTSQPCRGDCGSYLHQLRNIHTALRDNGARLRSFAIPLNRGSADAWIRKDAEFPDTLLRPGSENDLRDLIARFATAAGVDTAQADGFYLVDPLGNLMMRYETNANFMGILKDLQRLVKYSRVGR